MSTLMRFMSVEAFHVLYARATKCEARTSKSCSSNKEHLYSKPQGITRDPVGYYLHKS